MQQDKRELQNIFKRVWHIGTRCKLARSY